ASPAGIGQGIASLAGGWVVLLALLVGETDEAFADIYSAAVSSQNLLARLSQRRAILAVAAAGTALAAWLGLHTSVALGNFESFLFLMGSVFVPLFGVFVGDYFLAGRGRVTEEAFDPGRTGPKVNRTAFVAWIVGFLVYEWSVRTGPKLWRAAMQTLLADWLRLPYPLAGSKWGAR